RCRLIVSNVSGAAVTRASRTHGCRADKASATAEPQRAPLAGKSAWIVTDGKAGMEVQVAGVAKALGAEAIPKRVSPGAPWRWLAPWGPVDPAERFGKSGSQFVPPFPDIALATGRLSIPALRAIRR